MDRNHINTISFVTSIVENHCKVVQSHVYLNLLHLLKSRSSLDKLCGRSSQRGLPSSILVNSMAAAAREAFQLGSCFDFRMFAFLNFLFHLTAWVFCMSVHYVSSWYLLDLLKQEQQMEMAPVGAGNKLGSSGKASQCS